MADKRGGDTVDSKLCDFATKRFAELTGLASGHVVCRPILPSDIGKSDWIWVFDYAENRIMVHDDILVIVVSIFSRGLVKAEMRRGNIVRNILCSGSASIPTLMLPNEEWIVKCRSFDTVNPQFSLVGITTEAVGRTLSSISFPKTASGVWYGR